MNRPNYLGLLFSIIVLIFALALPAFASPPPTANQPMSMKSQPNLNFRSNDRGVMQKRMIQRVHFKPSSER